MLELPNTFQFYPDSFLPFGVKRGIPSNVSCGALMDIGFSQQKPWCSYGRIIKFAYVIARHWPGTAAEMNVQSNVMQAFPKWYAL